MMTRRNLLGLLMVFVLLAAACGSRDDDDEEVVPITKHEVDIRAPQEHLVEQEDCWYRSGLVLAPKTVRFEGDELNPPLTVGEVSELGQEFNNLGEGDIPALLELVDIYAIPPDVDPLQAALNMGNGAAPVLLAGFAGHWAVAPGGSPDDNIQIGVDPMDLFTEVADEPTHAVAVVDTGVVDFGETAPWPAGRIRPASQFETEHATVHPDVQGHGMFVSSLILQQDLGAEVIIARAGNVPVAEFVPDGDWVRRPVWDDHVKEINEGSLTDELQMFFAINRLLQVEDVDYRALNVSMGTYDCAGTPAGLAIRAGLKLWQDMTDNMPVVAAAGNTKVPNDPVDHDFLPADLDPGLEILLDEEWKDESSFSDLNDKLADDFFLGGPPPLPIVPIDAVDIDGTTTVADYSNTKAGHRTAVGTDLLGVRLPSRGITSWSGTSFATAIASGSISSGQSLPSETQFPKNPEIQQKPSP